jgi:aspartate carbamoyltransferase regulatory subunit
MLLLKNSFVPDELMIAMKSLAPSVKLGIAKDGNWIRLNVEAPGIIRGLGKCLNENCITSNCSGECQTKFMHKNGYLSCLYCGNGFTLKEILA